MHTNTILESFVLCTQIRLQKMIIIDFDINYLQNKRAICDNVYHFAPIVNVR